MTILPCREQQNASLDISSGIVDPTIAISVHEASGHSANTSVNNTSSLSNYFGTPQSSGDSVFDTLATPSAGTRPRSRENSANEVGGGFQVSRFPYMSTYMMVIGDHITTITLRYEIPFSSGCYHWDSGSQTDEAREGGGGGLTLKHPFPNYWTNTPCHIHPQSGIE